MTHFGRKLTIFIAIIRIVDAVNVPYSLEDYVVSVIKHLTSVDTADPSVVFYDLSPRNPFQEGVLGKVLRDPLLENVGRSVISCGEAMNRTEHLSTKPSLILLQGDIFFCFNRLLRHLQAFSSSTKVLILVSSKEEELMYNVGSFCYEEFMVDNDVDFDCTLYTMRATTESLFETLAAAMTSSEVVLVPRSPLILLQLFVIPFDWTVWLILSVLIGILEIIHLMYSSTFRNDPLLFVVCGFEEHDLHKTSRREKLILLSMVVLMFFITNAYSTKLIAMLINRPPSHPIRTLQDLVESGIKIKSNAQVYSYLSKHHILGNLTVLSNETVINMDMVHAHVVVRETAVGVLPMYYDHEHRLFRYHILDQTLNMVIYKFRLGRRSRLLEAFQFVCTALIEAGIEDYWRSTKFGNFVQLEATHNEIDEMLHFADLRLAWIALLGGMVASGAVFGLEVCLNKIICGSWKPMAYSGRYLTIFTLVTCFTSTMAVRYSLVNYIVATINHLATADTAVPKVVFYDLSPRNPFHEGLLGRVIRDPRLDSSVSRIVISCGENMKQKYDLHQTTRREKLILLAMVVFMFFMTNAYSTKLIELLINRPASHPIRTLQDLVASGIKIKSNAQVNHYLSKHHILGNSTVVSNESVFNMDLIHAHVVVRETAVGVLPMYYDHKHRIWRELETMYSEVDEMLHFADLTPAWMALLGGLVIAGVAFGWKASRSLGSVDGQVRTFGGNRDYVNVYLLQFLKSQVAEFDQFGKVLNKEKYEEYKKRQDNEKTATSEEPRLQKELKKESPPPRVTSREDRTQQHSSRSQHREDRDREDRHSRQDRERDPDRRRDSSSSEDDSRHRSHHKPSRTSSGTKKKSHKYKQHRREYSRERDRGSRDRERNYRRGSSDEDEETRRRDAHKQKKTKKSKRQRSRSR
ncbi:hypothetical protein pipiens_008208 [Culex pipiens pipiens]|uniref:Ionotropic receptor n=1 Tax=Culex pipiens pipiens TaxID=38569 RepID=A0ABD1DI80_CULPP